MSLNSHYNNNNEEMFEIWECDSVTNVVDILFFFIFIPILSSFFGPFATSPPRLSASSAHFDCNFVLSFQSNRRCVFEPPLTTNSVYVIFISWNKFWVKLEVPAAFR